MQDQYLKIDGVLVVRKTIPESVVNTPHRIEDLMKDKKSLEQRLAAVNSLIDAARSVEIAIDLN